MVLAACRLLVAISVQSAEVAADEVSLVELRVLVFAASRSGVTVSQVADAVGLHMSRASRTCERLVRARLLQRAADPDDRRAVRFTLGEDGRRLVDRVAQARRDAVEPALRSMSPAARTRLVAALEEFVDVVGEPRAATLWAMGWVTRPAEGA